MGVHPLRSSGAFVFASLVIFLLVLLPFYLFCLPADTSFICFFGDSLSSSSVLTHFQCRRPSARCTSHSPHSLLLFPASPFCCYLSSHHFIHQPVACAFCLHCILHHRHYPLLSSHSFSTFSYCLSAIFTFHLTTFETSHFITSPPTHSSIRTRQIDIRHPHNFSFHFVPFFHRSSFT